MTQLKNFPTPRRVLIDSRWIAVVFGALFLSGCGGASSSPPLAFVDGVVTLDGKPLPNAEISFSPKAGGRPSAGTTDATGKFELKFSEEEKGAIIGSHSVRIWTADRHTAPRNPDGSLGIAPGELVPQKYMEPDAIVKDVVSGKNTLNIELTNN